MIESESSADEARAVVERHGVRVAPVESLAQFAAPAAVHASAVDESPARSPAGSCVARSVTPRQLQSTGAFGAGHFAKGATQSSPKRRRRFAQTDAKEASRRRAAESVAASPWASWWEPWQRQYVQAQDWFKNECAPCARELVVASACTGMFSEGAILKAFRHISGSLMLVPAQRSREATGMFHAGSPPRALRAQSPQALGVPIAEHGFGCGPKSESRHYVAEAHSDIVSCWYSNIQDMMREDWPCCNHLGRRQMCRLPPPGVVDFLPASGPCQPWSRQRRNLRLPEEHELHASVMSSSRGLVGLVKRLLPKVFSTENVMTFNHRRQRGRYAEVSPMEAFTDAIYRETQASNGGEPWYVAHATLQTDSIAWVDSRRPR